MAFKFSKFYYYSLVLIFLAIPVLGLAAFFFSPESPVYLVSMEKYQQVLSLPEINGK
jgi:ABC-type spermidine/putrescine transport system permease subunit II